MTISVGRCLKRKTVLVWVKEYINKNLGTCKSLCNLQEFYSVVKEKHPNVNIGLSKICAWRPNSQKRLTLFVFVALIKMLCCLSMQWMETLHTKTWSNQLCLALSISIKIYLQSLLYHRHSQEHFFNCNIASSPYVEMLLISMIKLLLLFYLSDRNLGVACCNLRRL